MDEQGVSDFLFFLVLSGIFWLMMTLNETYEKELPVAVRLTGALATWS